MVPRRGLEPPRGYPHQHLKLARLPISPPRHPEARRPEPGPALQGGELYERTDTLSTRGTARRWVAVVTAPHATRRPADAGRRATRKVRGSGRSRPRRQPSRRTPRRGRAGSRSGSRGPRSPRRARPRAAPP